MKIIIRKYFVLIISIVAIMNLWGWYKVFSDFDDCQRSSTKVQRVVYALLKGEA